jgi:hypothetical protein
MRMVVVLTTDRRKRRRYSLRPRPALVIQEMEIVVNHSPDARTLPESTLAAKQKPRQRPPHGRRPVHRDPGWGHLATPIVFLTRSATFWSTLSIVMHRFSANAKTYTGVRGAISTSVIRISGHNVRAGIGA